MKGKTKKTAGETTVDNLDAISVEVEQQFPGFVTAVRKEFQIKLDTALDKEKQDLRKANEAAFQKAVEEFKKSQEPPNHDDVRKMLDAEYLEFPFQVRVNGKKVELVLQELPASVERKFLRLLKEKLAPYARQLAELTMHLAEGQVEDKITMFLEALEPAADFVHEGVALILSAYDQKLTADEVRNSMALSRQLGILKAQMECNRVRDFFSLASQIAVP